MDAARKVAKEDTGEGFRVELLQTFVGNLHIRGVPRCAKMSDVLSFSCTVFLATSRGSSFHPKHPPGSPASLATYTQNRQ